MISQLVVACLAATAQINVVVTLDDGKANQDSAPISGATVQLLRNGVNIGAAEPTDANGATNLSPKKEPVGTDELTASKEDFKSSRRFWKDVADDDPIYLKLEPKAPKDLCEYTVYRPVYQTRSDGTVDCYVVQETKVRDCSQPGPRYLYPTSPPPHGFKYQFAYAITRWDASRQAFATRPYWHVVPVCPQAAPMPYTPPQPCACQ